MKAIDLRQALIEANNVNLNGADALVETRAMRQLIESCKARIEELEPEATELAKAELTKLGIPKGQFMHEGYKFEAQRTDEYDFVGKPQKYTMPEGVTFRQKTAEQKDLKAKILRRQFILIQTVIIMVMILKKQVLLVDLIILKI